MPTVWPYWVGQQMQPTGTFGSANTWNVWITQTTATTLPQTQSGVWGAWAGQPQTLGLPNQFNIWLQWQNSLTPIYTSGFLPTAQAPPAPPTPEQLAARERNSLIRRNRVRASEIRRKFAARKAEALLLEHLNTEQREEWLAERAFTVHTADGKRAYKIAYGLAGNVRLVEADEAPVSRYGRPIHIGARFCMHVYHPDGQVPNEDNVLAQKLLIESNEREFLAHANVS